MRRAGLKSNLGDRNTSTVAFLLLFLSWFVFIGKADAAPGDLDPTFGSGGLVTKDFGGNEIALDMAIQADGKIVTAGTSTDFFSSNLILPGITLTEALIRDSGPGE